MKLILVALFGLALAAPQDIEPIKCCIPAVRTAEDGTECTKPCAADSQPCANLSDVCTVLIPAECPQKAGTCRATNLNTVQNFRSDCDERECEWRNEGDEEIPIKWLCEWSPTNVPCSVQTNVMVCRGSCT